GFGSQLRRVENAAPHLFRDVPLIALQVTDTEQVFGLEGRRSGRILLQDTLEVFESRIELIQIHQRVAATDECLRNQSRRIRRNEAGQLIDAAGEILSA